jgi:outer membrane immunogenic protein
MRRVMLGLLGLVFVSDAIAADYPDYLRGSSFEAPPARYNWAGVYFGGQAGYAKAEINFGSSLGTLAGNLGRQSFLQLTDAQIAAGLEGTRVSEWLALPRTGASGSSYGAFVGYNTQWGDAVFGAELNYNRVSLAGAASDAISRLVTVDDFGYPVFLFGNASATITDYATIRFRAGYAAGWFLPYVTAGLAVGRANYAKSVTLGYGTPIDLLPPPTPPDAPRPNPGPFGPVVASEVKNGVLSIGYAVGAGVDVGLLPNVFVRFEYEYVEVGNFGGISAAVNNFRTGAAVKF